MTMILEQQKQASYTTVGSPPRYTSTPINNNTPIGTHRYQNTVTLSGQSSTSTSPITPELLFSITNSLHWTNKWLKSKNK